MPRDCPIFLGTFGGTGFVKCRTDCLTTGESSKVYEECYSADSRMKFFLLAATFESLPSVDAAVA